MSRRPFAAIRARRRFGPVEPFEFGVELLARGIVADFGRMPVEPEAGAGVAHGVHDVAEFIDGHFTLVVLLRGLRSWPLYSGRGVGDPA